MMFVLRSTFDSSMAAYHADNLRLRQELADERADKHKLAETLRSVTEAVEAERAVLAEVARNLHTAIQDATKDATGVIGRELMEARLELTRERAQRELLALQLRISQKDADWLRVLVNTANTERASVLAQHGMGVPVPTIRPFQVPMAPNPDARPGMASPDVGSGLPGPLQEFLDSGAMEDMGDEAAARAGIGHNDDGSLHFGPLTQ